MQRIKSGSLRVRSSSALNEPGFFVTRDAPNGLTGHECSPGVQLTKIQHLANGAVLVAERFGFVRCIRYIRSTPFHSGQSLHFELRDGGVDPGAVKFPKFPEERSWFFGKSGNGHSEDVCLP